MNAARWLLAVGVCLVALGAKLTLVRTYGSDVPFWDQWDAEAGALFIPHGEHRLAAGAFFAPHNEHRIVATRALNYSLTVANGQWDPHLEMAVNAMIHAAFAGLLVLFASRLVRGLALLTITALIVAAFVLPLAWENTLAGFQSQFYFLAWTSVGFLWLTVPARPLGPRWWLGLGVGVLGLGTMSSGFFCCGAALAIALGRAFIWDRRRAPRDFAAMGVYLALCGVGLALTTHVPGHDAIRASSPLAWLRSLLTVLAWPANRWIVAACVIQLPLALHLLARIRARALAADDELLLSLAVWWWAQAAAIAYARANFGINLSPRYYDLYALGIILNALALLRLRPGPGRHVWPALAAGWCALVVIGTTAHLKTARQFLDSFLASNPAVRAHVSRFVRDGNVAAFIAEPDKLPLPAPQQLAAYLAHPALQPFLPASIRRPLPLVAATADGFVRAAADARPAHPDFAVWRAPRGPARFVSAPLSATLPVLRVTFAGDARFNGSVMRLESADGHRTELSIDRIAGDRWQTAHLEIPRGGQVRLIVELPPGAPGFSFADPVELGAGSFYVHHLLKLALLPLAAGVLLVVSGGTLLAWAARSPQIAKKG